MTPPEPPPPASLLVPALLRQVSAAGDFATVLARGAPSGTALLIVHRTPGRVQAAERVPDLSAPSGLRWRLAADGEEAVAAFLERQRRFDPDCWVIELDTAEPARFVPGWPAPA